MGKGSITSLDRRTASEAATQDRIIMGAERKTQYIDDKVKKLTAYHEVSGADSSGELIFRRIYTGRARIGCTVYRRSHAVTQSNMCPSRSCIGNGEYME